MNARTQAILYDFITFALFGFLGGLIPLLEELVRSDLGAFDWRKFLLAVITAALSGIIGALRKLLAPQLVSVGTTAEGKPSIVGVSLKDIKPEPPKVDTVEQKPVTARTRDAIGAEHVER